MLKSRRRNDSPTKLQRIITSRQKAKKKKKNFTLLLILMRELNKCISAVGVRFSHETAELMIWKILATVKRTFMLYVWFGASSKFCVYHIPLAPQFNSIHYICLNDWLYKCAENRSRNPFQCTLRAYLSVELHPMLIKLQCVKLLFKSNNAIKLISTPYTHFSTDFNDQLFNKIKNRALHLFNK